MCPIHRKYFSNTELVFTTEWKMYNYVFSLDNTSVVYY